MPADYDNTAETEVNDSSANRRPVLTRRRVLGTTALAVALLGGGTWAGTITGVLPPKSAQAAPSSTFSGATEQITRGVLAGETSASGTLRFSDPRALKSSFDGVVTQLPTPGTVLHHGDKLYQVADRAAYLMGGTIPAWRDFDISMKDGEDIRQLENGLRILGFFTDEPDNRFDWVTANAVTRWQKAMGMEQTGRIPLGTIQFADGDIRVGTLSARVGDRTGADAALYNVTSANQVVDANLKLADQNLAVVGNKVNLRLPGGVNTTGTITSVGTPTEKSGSGDNKERVIPITITPDDLSVTAPLQESSLTIGLPSERRENVLSVPVGALLALTPSQFGVEIVHEDGTTQKVPVTTGLFAAGRVEISGEGISEGQRVVVPQR